MPEKYGTVRKYMKFIKQPKKQTQHHKFLEALRVHIKNQNEHPDGVKIRCAGSICDAYEKFEAKHETGTEFKAPAKEFVLVEGWTEQDGTYREDQVVSEMVFGKLMRGIWKTTGEDGHYKFKKI